MVRNDGPEGTKAKSSITARERFQLKRDATYARRKMKVYGLVWVSARNPITNIPRYRMVFDNIEAVVVDAGLMSYCTVTVGQQSVQRKYSEEEFAGFGGVHVAALRGTQHVIAIIEERAKLALEAMDGPA